MPRYEYKVVPAPKKPGKIRGVRGTENRFAAELSTLMNAYGAEGWEYQRTDTLPCEERQGLTGRTTTFQNMLVFRREIKEIEEEEPAERPVQAQPADGESVVVLPTFRKDPDPATAPAITGATAQAPEGKAPELGAPTAPEPGKAPSIAAQ